MATKDRKNVEILLSGVDISHKVGARTSRHLVTVELLWPRPMLASKISARTLKLAKGVVDAKEWQWHRRILFKESVEYRFGLVVKVSESVTSSAVEGFFRFFASSLFGLGADLVEDTIPGMGGDAAAVPLDYAKKVLAKTKEPDMIAEGGVDLLPAELTETMEVEIPLLSSHDSYKVKYMRTPGEHGKGTTRKLDEPAGTVIGKALLRINCLK